MKKLLLMMLTVLIGMSSLSLSAQSTLTVADGTTTNSYVPVYGLYVDDFVRCQTIYPAGMLADLTGESILGLVYYLSTPAAASWGSATFVVNIMEVADTALTGFVDMSNATLVYSGSLDATQSTMEINFAFPYTYMGGNLLIEIYNTLEGTYKSASFYGITATGASWQGYNGTSVENITGSTRAFIPKTTFLYGNPPTCFKVTNQNIDAAQTTSTSLTLTWIDTINTGATYEIYDMSDTSLVAAGINDYSYTVMNLTSNTAYTLGIQTNCGGGDIANGYAIVNGRTACDLVTTLPWTDDLEAVPSGDYQMPFCWNRYTSAFTTTTTYPYSYSSSTYAHGGTRSLYFYGTTGDAYPDTMIAITPEFDVITYPMNENRVSFWARMGTASNSKNIYVGTMTDPTDPTTFTLADSILVSGNVYTKYNVALTNVTGSYVAFVVYKGAGTMYVDDITLEVAPSCLEVTNLAVSATSTNSITLTWNDNHNPDGTGYTVYNMADTSDVNATINGNSALIENLDANTLYTFGVESNCASGDDAAIVTVSGRTECDVFTAPYTWTFEDMTASAAPLCWTKIGTGTVNVISSTTNSHDGTMYVRFSGSTSNLVALPETQDEIGTLQLRFWTRPESYTNTSCGNFSVGYITDITDATTFVEVANYVYNDFSAYEEKTVTFAGAPAGARMAMRHNAGSTSWYWYIDDVTIEEAPDCLPVSGLTVSNITTNDATLSWTGDAASYVVYDMSDTSVIASGVSATTYDLSGLDAMTSYTFGVAAECGADISPIVSVAFNTACTAVSLPYTETFESTSASRECWTLFGYGNLSGSTGMGFVTINGHEALRFSSYSNADDYNQYGFSPLMDVNPTANNLLVNVVYATYGANDKLNFGYITETDTIWITTEYTTSGSSDWQSVDVIIPASATQFAIHYYGNYSYYAWIDTIAVSEMVGDFCYAVNDLTVDDVTENSVTISWTDENNSGATYTILNLTDTTVVATGLTSTSYDILGLDPMTLYTFGVVANCSSSDVSDMVTVSALTLCVAVAIPFTEGFEMDSPTLGCWSLANTAANTGLTTSNPYTGSVAFIFAYNTNPPQYLFSPELSGTENGLLVSFMYSVQSTSFPESFQLGYSTTTNDTAAFTWGVEQTNLTNLTYEEYSEILPAGVKYVCIKYTANDMYFLYIDDVTFMTPPSCLPVSDLTVDTATSNSVTISWTGTAASYDLYNGETFVANVTGNTYTFNGLSASFNYTFGVQAICSATDTAAMVTVSASTDCGLITNYPYVQDFTVAPACWMALDADGDGNNWILYNGTIQSASYSGGALTPDNWLISPQFAIPATGNYEVTWTATAQDQSWPAEHYGIFVSTTGYSDTANFTMLQEWTLSTGIFNPVVDLSAYSGQNIYIALRHFNCTDQYRPSTNSSSVSKLVLTK